MLDIMGLKYTHSGIETSVIAIDKELTKAVLVPHGIRMPAGEVVESESLHAGDPMARPYVLKPVNEGSSVGVAIVTREGNYGDPIGRDVEGPWQHFARLLAEPFIKGRELTVAVLGERPLAVTEIRHDHGFFDYHAKYTANEAVHLIPAPVAPAVYQRALDHALTAHRLLGCRGVSSADFRLDDDDPDGLFLLEVNTQPGMTPISLVPEQAAHVGIGFADLVERLVEEARCDA
jgi:D-alanine-D-alanine ligase